MGIEFYYAPDDVRDSPENDGLHGAELSRTVRRIREVAADYRVIDVSEQTRDEQEDAYLRLAVPPSMFRRYRVRRTFGTHGAAGAFFGKGVPALIVTEHGRPRDVYPHEEQDGTIVTIKDYLDRLERGGGVDLAARMDALRAQIGNVGATARDLIEEGRRR